MRGLIRLLRLEVTGRSYDGEVNAEARNYVGK